MTPGLIFSSSPRRHTATKVTQGHHFFECLTLPHASAVGDGRREPKVEAPASRVARVSVSGVPDDLIEYVESGEHDAVEPPCRTQWCQVQR